MSKENYKEKNKKNQYHHLNRDQRAQIEILINEKDKTFEEIKVSDICKKALINRSTFYSHYNDKYELLVDFINVLKEEFVNELNSNNENLNTREFFINLIGLFLNHIESKKDVYSSIMINNRNGIMIDILLSVVTDDMLKKINSDYIGNKIPSDIITKFYLGGVLNIGIEWLSNSNKYTKKEILSYLEFIIPDIN